VNLLLDAIGGRLQPAGENCSHRDPRQPRHSAALCGTSWASAFPRAATWTRQQAPEFSSQGREVAITKAKPVQADPARIGDAQKLAGGDSSILPLNRGGSQSRCRDQRHAWVPLSSRPLAGQNLSTATGQAADFSGAPPGTILTDRDGVSPNHLDRPLLVAR